MDLNALYNIGYGMYIVSSKGGEKFNGQIANTVFQITAEPPTIAISINKQNLTHKFIEESKIFTISILSKETPIKFIGDFGFKSGKEVDKFKNVEHKISSNGMPIVTENTIGYVEAKVVNSLDMGTHTIFVGVIVDAETIKKEEPMTYAYYHTVKRGTSPKTAPTYINPDVVQQTKEMVQLRSPQVEKYKCKICGYIYDPQKGDAESNIKSGTSFDELPKDWLCPICGADKSEFVKQEEK
jgi:flavin reductase (DIM6/NTAB) family NADH-FMN oxidoreductase RutF/rubredoxin